ncbi:hypothetical protein ASPWEDRAFT_41067 [Aspergillus wentii DTO 134E9]|uniref:Glycosyltransferase 2-like domain-containing protein n=1 Tax=Aspergillus wentii DTO 134E9 TaxID=1073089 RepID=A0A1L9RLK3_ASPWE|nr:uncharacterized protein ASPWEDRAFT_41067 [Aspergillus wentii DTO 134E9]KAI9929719.1 hypothetical protein MW887_001195 [Aspergillus wentii]OJJ35825.1 hypothetical protein ASPWEDRAFT_41067 [Aspergillus wentii DTO 134E9]
MGLSTRFPAFYSRGPVVSVARQFVNFLGCLVILPVYWFITKFSRHPLTLDILISIFVAEFNRYANEGRRRTLYKSNTTADIEKRALSPCFDIGPDCMSVVVGYREDPDLFSRALQSYKTAQGCRFLLVGVDGDNGPDLEMVDVFQQVYPEDAATIHISEPFGETAMRTFEKLSKTSDAANKEMCNELAIAHCCQLAREILADHDLGLGEPGGVTRLCLYQPHRYKKAIMFTSFIFSIVISDILGIEYLWSSDSDTIVFPDTLQGTISTIAGDKNAGGASSGLIVHNAHESLVTKLGSAVYWCELYMTRSTSASSGTSDCQSGPSTAFRVSALPGILYNWYTQTVWGQRMVVNEDRHLTTNLLMRGWTVTYVSDTLAATDTPTTLSRWLLQQVRWGRATHIETFQQPRVYLLNHPIFFWAAFKREMGPILVFACIVWYLFTGYEFIFFSFSDIVSRITYTILYNYLRNPDRGPRLAILWILPALLFYNIPLPAIHVWSLATYWESGWGTSMRSNAELSKHHQFWKRMYDLGFFVVWMGVVGGATARLVAGYAGWEGVQMARAIVLGVIVPMGGSFYGLIV